MIFQKFIVILAVVIFLTVITKTEAEKLRVTKKHQMTSSDKDKKKHKKSKDAADDDDKSKEECDRSDSCASKLAWRDFKDSSKGDDEKVTSAQKVCNKSCDTMESYKGCKNPQAACETHCGGLDSASEIKKHEKDKCTCEQEEKDGKKTVDCNKEVEDNGSVSRGIVVGLAVCGVANILMMSS
eukprot:Filipodium_phascolosomae@DN6710_c0_g1_i1.p1